MKHRCFASQASLPLFVVALLLATGCQSVYYGAMEKMGTHKRDILVERVEEGKEAQEDAKAQFASAFEEFVAVSNVELGDLKTAYERLQDSFDRSEKRARAVWDRIDSIKGVSKALFKEWESELGQYTNQDLRQVSQDQMNQTKILYLKLIGAMEGAAEKMDPVLDAFRDQTLFLKHNLNAQAIAALNKTTLGMRSEVDALIQQMSQSIEEANSFIAKMRSGQ
ncbi:DUF2959 domain-containing protein [Opitutaceae bacterium]|nr:DUF2959 domain-containing protein [Opitutaceae bacterium]